MIHGRSIWVLAHLLALVALSAATIPEVTPIAAIELPSTPDRCCSGDANGDAETLPCGYPLEGGDRFARSSAGGADIDGDGVPDVVIGSSRDGDGQHRAGAVYVLNLNADGTVKHTQKISATYGMADGVANPFSRGGTYALEEEDRFGYSVGRIGDVDGDGVDDIVVGSDGDDDGNSGGHDAGKKVAHGAVFVVFLNQKGRAKKIQKISGIFGGLEASTIHAGDGFGQSANGIGDIDGDGVPDIAVGAPGYNRTGAVFLLCLTKEGTVKSQHKLDMGTNLTKGDAFGGRSIAVLSSSRANEVRLLIGANAADTHGAMWNVRITNSTKAVAHKTKISSNGDGGFPFSASATKSSNQTNTDSSEFGNSLAAIGDIDGDGVADCAVSANNGGVAGKGILYVLTLKDDGTVKAGIEIDPDNLSSDQKDGPLAALADTAKVPSGDRLCRSMSAPGIVAVKNGTTNAFSILCGAGAHGEFGGDLWLFAFLSKGESGNLKAAPVVPQPTFCPVEKSKKNKDKERKRRTSNGWRSRGVHPLLVWVAAAAAVASLEASLP